MDERMDNAVEPEARQLPKRRCGLLLRESRPY